MNDLEFEKKIQLKRCRESRESTIKEIGYSDEFNPFGDNNLSLPFIWKKKFEQEKKDHSFTLKCNVYPWYKFGVCPINTAEIIEIKKRRENIEETLTNKIPSDDHFDYEKWIEDEKRFEKLQLHSSSIVRVKEHRGNLFDVFFWKFLVYSYFTTNSLETKNSSAILSLLKMGLTTSKSYLNHIKHKKLFKMLDEVFITQYSETNSYTSELFQIVNKHLQSSNITTDIHFIPEWQDILEGLEIILKSGISKYNETYDFYKTEDQEINKILENKEMSELKDILRQSNTKNDDYWKIVAIHTKVRICKINIESIERTYYENFEKWMNLLASKHNIIQDKNHKKNESIGNRSHASGVGDLSHQFEDNEKEDQLIELPIIEFSPSKESTANNICHLNKLVSPYVYSMMKARYYWNQYNKNYYSNETLPPKIIQGYKIKIKYPLLNKVENVGVIPRWYLTTKNKYLEKNNLSVTNEEVLLKVQEDIILCENEISVKNKLLIVTCDHQIYKDVGFPIIDKEWDLNPKNGFKSYFENATLHLNFNFKQPKYKR